MCKFKVPQTRSSRAVKTKVKFLALQLKPYTVVQNAPGTADTFAYLFWMWMASVQF